MRQELWGRISELFEAALGRPAGERHSYLKEACRDDDELFGHVSHLLSQFDKAGDFLEQPIFSRPQSLASGSVIGGRYRIEAIIGRGGMGEVYRAHDELVGEKVALKTLRSDHGDDPEFLRRFRREVQLARKVTHPSVCRVFEVGIHCGEDSRELHFFVMQLVEGETLAARIRRLGRLSREDTLALAVQMADGLEAAHVVGIVHRDFKSANVMLQGDRAVIMDFGLARAAFGDAAHSDAGGSISRGTQVAGTVAYMSPEQLSGGPLTTATDLYSFGVVLFEMTTGRPPFNDAHIIRSAMQRVVEAAPDVRAMAPEIDAQLAAVIARCLRSDAAKRFPTAAALAAALRRKHWLSPLPYWNRRQWIKAGAAAAVSVGGMALVPAALRFSSSDVTVREGAEVLVGSIANSTGDARFDGIAELFRNQLAQSVQVNLISDERLAGVLVEMGSPDDTTEPAAIRAGAWRLNAALCVFGNVSRIGPDYALNVQVETRGSQPDHPRSKALRSFSASEPTGLMRSVRDASVWIREVIGESDTTIASFDRLPEYATTPSWEALAVYARGQRLFLRQDFESAILEFEAALRIDPQFTLAALRRADLLMSQGRHTQGIAQWRTAMQMLEERPVTRPEELHARAMFAFDSGDMDASERFARTWAVEYPTDWQPPYYRVGALTMNGRARQSLELLEPLRVSVPEYGDIYAMMIVAHLVLGQTDEARALLPELRKRNRPERADLREAYVRFREGDLPGYLEMLRLVQRSKTYPRGVIDAVISEALLLVDCALPEAAAAKSETFLRTKSLAETGSQELSLLMIQSWAEMLAGRRETAIEHAGEVWKNEQGPVIAALAGTIFARLGRADLASEVLAVCAGFRDIPNYLHATHRILGEQARAEGRTTAAIGELRAAATLEPKIAHRQYLLEALPLEDPERLDLSLNVVRIPWQRIRPPPLHCLGSLSLAVPVVLAAANTNEPFARRFEQGRADVARMV